MKMQNTIKLLMISNWLSIDIGIHTIWYGVGSHQPLVGSFFTNKLATNKKKQKLCGPKDHRNRHVRYRDQIKAKKSVFNCI